MICIQSINNYSWQVHKPNTVLDTIVSADNCSSTTIGCGAVGQLEFNHKTCADPATKQQVEQLELKLEQTIENQVDDLSKKLETQAEQIDALTKMVKDNFDLMEKPTCVSNEMGETVLPMSPTLPPTGSESEGS
jgi:esterase/lipase